MILIKKTASQAPNTRPNRDAASLLLSGRLTSTISLMARTYENVTVPGFLDLIEREATARKARAVKPKAPPVMCGSGHKHLNAKFAAACDKRHEP
jgi:hypothetical protein